MALYADENFSLPVVLELRRLGIDVLTVSEDGKANQGIPDDEILARAVELGRAVLTGNRQDFKRLHRIQPNHAGIIICTFDADFIGQANRIAAALASTDELTGDELTGKLIRVYRPASPSRAA